MKDFIQASNRYSNNFKDPLDFKGGMFPEMLVIQV